MNVLSLFDGISCGRVALDRAGLPVSIYLAAEVDPYAIAVSRANWPDTVQLGDVNNWQAWGLDWANIDLVIGGSPCQGFSFAGKQLAFDDPRSKLFFVYVDILNYIKAVNPNVKFLLENVRMKKEYLDVISQQLGVEPVLINSALVSAQNRQRFYWCNWSVGQPANRGIMLADIIESGTVDREKSLCVNTRVAGATEKRYKEKAMHQMVIEKGVIKNHGEWKELSEKSQCIDANYHKGVDNHGQRTMITDGTYYRKLTPIECERLMGLPDDYTNHVSNTQRYKMLGNGWEVNTVTHVFSQI